MKNHRKQLQNFMYFDFCFLFFFFFFAISRYSSSLLFYFFIKYVSDAGCKSDKQQEVNMSTSRKQETKHVCF